MDCRHERTHGRNGNLDDPKLGEAARELFDNGKALLSRIVEEKLLTQMATVRLGKRTEHRAPLIKDLVPLAELEDVVFGAWDPIPDDAYDSARHCGVLKPQDLDPIADFMKTIKPMPAVFDKAYVKKLDGTNVKTGANKLDLAEQIRADIRRFKEENACSRLSMVWAASHPTRNLS